MPGHVKVGGSWKSVATPSVKVGGSWKAVDAGYTKVAGAWKQWYTAIVPGDYELIQTIEVPPTQATSISFTSIPSDYKHLQIRVAALGNSTTTQNINLTFNNDTSANYSRFLLRGNGSTVTSSNSVAQTSIQLNFLSDTSSNNPGVAIIDILDYKSVDKNVTVKSLEGSIDTNNFYTRLEAGFYATLTPISSITMQPAQFSFNAYSRFSLYGIRG